MNPADSWWFSVAGLPYTVNWRIATPVYLFWDHVFFFQAEDGIRDPLWSRGLGDVYKRQRRECGIWSMPEPLHSRIYVHEPME